MTKRMAAGKIPQKVAIHPLEIGKNKLLVIGIDHYLHHQTLSNAVADAKGFYDVMTTRYGFEELSEPLYNESATKTNIINAIGKAESLGESDRLIVFYAGHGWYKPKSKVGYIVPTEANDNPNLDFLNVNSILDIFKAVDAKHILFIVDCCFGGSFRNIETSKNEKEVRSLDMKKSRKILSSGGIEPVKDGYADSNSPFTEPLLKILKENQQPMLVFSNFFDTLRKETHFNTDQLPEYGDLRHLGHKGGELGLICTDLKSKEQQAYEKAILENNTSLYVDFLFVKEFENTEYKEEIKERLRVNRAGEAWKIIEKSEYIEDFKEFTDNPKFNNTEFHLLAEQRLEVLRKKIENEKIEKKKIKIQEFQEDKVTVEVEINHNNIEPVKPKVNNPLGEEIVININKEDSPLNSLLSTIKIFVGFSIDAVMRFFQFVYFNNQSRTVAIQSIVISFMCAILFASYFYFTGPNVEQSNFTTALPVANPTPNTTTINPEIGKSAQAEPIIPDKRQLDAAKQIKIAEQEKIQKQRDEEEKQKKQNEIQKQAEIEIEEGRKAFRANHTDKAFPLLLKNKDNKSFDADAQKILAFMYETGQGVEKNYKEAKKWYQKAANNGDAVAQYKTGENYFNGNDFEQSYPEAIKWFKKSADQGNATGQYYLAIMYEKGYGVKPDSGKAIDLYRSAAVQEQPNAKVALNRLKKN
jgi:Caspase domain/Sel1 repeat